MSHMQTVMEIYEAFGRGDLDTVLSKLSDSIEWEYGEPTTTVPWLQRRTGKDGAATDLTASATQIETQEFMPKAFLEGEGVIVVLFDTKFTVNATGKRVVEEDAVHIWRFDDEGKVSRFRHRIDTLQQELACQA